MADYDYEPERAWDEYQWERFLQQQDHKTERYMDLLEKYLDHPNRDQIIAREMGWTHLLESKEESQWADEADALFPEKEESEENDFTTALDRISSRTETFEYNLLYQDAFALTVWIDHLFDGQPGLQNEPSAVKLATHAALGSAKLAAALSDEDVDELGMTIAYLKRSLKAITIAMDAGAALLREGFIHGEQHADLLKRLFQVRDGIVQLMGDYRREWRRRFGNR